MNSKELKEFFKKNKHRDFNSAKIEIEERLNVNNQEVSQILFYFFDEHGMGDYEILSSKKLPIDHPINKTLVKNYERILEAHK